ncbi:helix-turn-helix transcriptional regulator [Lishizhenia sp.]|uniref:helix-turn-helix domain-containing protein n=1 Tax=Lishizhenia sp. TaxID=2497594 RepID=UPI00299EC4DE|nr:helix-turn-helix transcriptional regulator [Lishizhenia sp.]MDX1446240.1 helix-turn-helix transcriptional regulator [Lishizhenia sp.]
MEDTVNTRVSELRKYLNLSQADFCQLVGMSTAGLSRIENGLTKAHKSTYRKIIERTNCSEDWLFRGKGEMFPKEQETVSESVSPKNSNWTEKAFEAIKSKNEHLEQEVKYLRDMLKHMITGKAESNFHNAISPAGIFLQESVWNSVSAQRA